MPDEVRRTVINDGTPRPASDARFDLVYFAQGLPHWCGVDGLPLSWGHYVIGVYALGQLDERRKIAMFDAMTMAQAIDENVRRTWIESVRHAAGY